MVFTELEIVTLSIFEQSRNASCPISDTPFGISIFVTARLLQPAKAFVPIFLICSGKLTVASEVQLKNKNSSIALSSAGSVICWRLLHSKKALPPIVFTLSGITISRKEIQLAKALSPILIMPLPIFTVVRAKRVWHPPLGISLIEDGIDSLCKADPFKNPPSGIATL